MSSSKLGEVAFGDGEYPPIRDASSGRIVPIEDLARYHETIVALVHATDTAVRQISCIACEGDAYMSADAWYVGPGASYIVGGPQHEEYLNSKPITRCFQCGSWYSLLSHSE